MARIAYQSSASDYETLANLVGSEMSLLAQSNEQYQSLIDDAEAMFTAGAVETCTYDLTDHDASDGAPPCIISTLSPSETATIRDNTIAQFQLERRLVEENAAEFHNLIQTAFPFDQCWP